MSQTMYGSFSDTEMAEKAAGALLDHGVRAEDLSLVSHESRYNLPKTTYEDTGTSIDATNPSTAAVETDYDADETDTDDGEIDAKKGISTTTGADAGSGAITGTAVGLGVGAIAALASLLVPGVGLVVGGGALATALGGMAATAGAGAAAGAVVGYLKDQGVDEHLASKYGEAISGGGAVLAVTVPSGDVDESQARMILEKYGAANVNAYAFTGERRYMA